MKIMRIAGCLVLAALLTNCSMQSPQETPWEAAGVSENFYYVAEDFSERFLTLDNDGVQYDKALDAVAQYLDGNMSQAEAQSAVQETLTDVEAALETSDTATLTDSLTEQLQAVGISAAEYELFANIRTSQLQTQQSRLSALALHLEYAEDQPSILETLRFLLTSDQSEQDSMRGYYYYGSFNYWFPWANEAELSYLRNIVTDRLACYCPTDAKWYTDADAIEQRVMLYLDEVEAVGILTAEYLGQYQADLDQLEQGYSDLLALIEENRETQEKLDAAM